MASPQIENGHVKIASEIVEQLARVNLSAYEWRVLWCILRKTYGWRKKSDSVPVSQIAEMTGLRQPHVSRAKASLLKKHLLFEQDGKLGFVKNYEIWAVEGFTYTDSGMSGHTNSGIKTAPSHTNSGTTHTYTGMKSIPIQGDSKATTTTTQQQQRTRKPAKPAYDGKGFECFWAAYPKKVAKKDAEKAWVKLRPSPELLETILAAVERQKTTEQWMKDGGKYIPGPAKWLNGERWADEIASSAELICHDATDEEADEMVKGVGR